MATSTMHTDHMHTVVKFIERLNETQKSELFVLDKFLSEDEFALLMKSEGEEDVLFVDMFRAGFRHVGDIGGLTPDQIAMAMLQADPHHEHDRQCLADSVHGVIEKIGRHLETRYELKLGSVDVSGWKQYRLALNDREFRFPWSLPRQFAHLGTGLDYPGRPATRPAWVSSMPAM